MSAQEARGSREIMISQIISLWVGGDPDKSGQDSGGSGEILICQPRRRVGRGRS
jgi:hypothetical protein